MSHSRWIRNRLRSAREDAGLTQEQVAHRILEEAGVKRTAASISAYEKFVQHPPIDVMAAWARAVGLFLVVDLADGYDNVRSTDTTRGITEMLPDADPEVVDMVRDLLSLWPKLDERGRDLIRVVLDRLAEDL